MTWDQHKLKQMAVDYEKRNPPHPELDNLILLNERRQGRTDEAGADPEQAGKELELALDSNKTSLPQDDRDIIIALRRFAMEHAAKRAVAPANHQPAPATPVAPVHNPGADANEPERDEEDDGPDR